MDIPRAPGLGLVLDQVEILELFFYHMPCTLTMNLHEYMYNIQTLFQSILSGSFSKLQPIVWT